MKSITFGMVLALCTSACVCADAAPQRECTLVVKGYVGTTELKDFPLLVRISPSLIVGFDYSQCAAGGADISFALEDGTRLSHEIDTWDTAGTSLVWVRVPKLVPKTTKIRFRWQDGNPPANVPTAVWGEYAGVWHLNDMDGMGKAVDATGHGFDATVSSNETTGVLCVTNAAKIGLGRTLPKMPMLVPNYDAQNVRSNFTASGWYYITTVNSGSGFFNRKESWNSGTGWQCNVQGTNPKTIFCTGSAKKYDSNVAITSVASRWVNLTLAYENTTLKVYDNGALIKTMTIDAAGDNARDLKVGSSMSGTIDEIRIRKEVSSADWIKAEYDQVNSTDFIAPAAAEIMPASFVSVRSNGETCGKVVPEYGLVPNPSAGEHVFTCVQDRGVSSVNLCEMRCTGWKIRDLTTGQVIRTSAEPGEGEGALTCRLAFAEGSRLSVEWQWAEEGEPEERNQFLGTVDGNWFTAENWSKGTVPTAADDVLITDKTVTAEGRIVARCLSLNGSTAALTIGKSDHSLNVGAGIASNLVVTAGAVLRVYAGELADYSTIFTNKTQAYYALYTNANVIAVGGSFTVGAGATVYPANSKISGTPVFFKAAGDIVVEDGATFDTRKIGWAFFKPSGTVPKGTTTICDGASYYTLAPAPGRSWSNGAGYGGKGHNSSAAYGFAFAPFLSGSPAGSQTKDNETTCSVNTRGSGSICLFSKGNVTVEGTLNANAQGYSNTDASGGGIWVAGHEVFLRSSAILGANGGAQVDGTASGGGGGRIAIVQGLDFSELDDLAVGVTAGYESRNLTHAGVTVTRGTRSNRTWNNADGTKKLVNAVNRCAVVTVGGMNVVASGLFYGEGLYPVGPYTFEIPMWAVDSNDTSISYTCYGCIVSNALGEVTRSFSNRCTVDLTGQGDPWTVTWLWGTREDVLAIDGFPAEGVDVSSPDSGIQDTVASGDALSCSVPERWTNATIGVIRKCVGWKVYDINGMVVAQGDGSVCNYTHPTPSAYRHLEWQWETVAQPNTFTGLKSVDWFDAANWSEGVVPTADDDAVINGKSVVAEREIAVSNLTVNGELASLTFGRNDYSVRAAAKIAGDFTITGAAKLYVYASELDDYSTVFTNNTDACHALYTNANVIAIGGTMTVKDGATVYPSNAKITGTPVFFRAGNIVVGTNGTFDTRKIGWAWTNTTKPTGAHIAYDNSSFWTLAMGPGWSWTGAAGYGGKGDEGGAIYGSVYGFDYAPFLSGSPGGYSANYASGFDGARASGSICLLATNIVTVLGTLNADALGYALTDASGGGIWVAGRQVFLGTSAVLTAQGGGRGTQGGGGGGRIAVLQGFTAAEIDVLATGSKDGCEDRDFTRSGVSVLRGLTSGKNWTNADGTKKLVNKTDAFAEVTVTSAVPIPEEKLICGKWLYPVGTYTFEAPLKTAGCVEPLREYVCYGYVLSNDVCEITRGASNRCTVELDLGNAPYTLTWLWGEYDDVLAVDGLPAYGAEVYAWPRLGVREAMTAGKKLDCTVQAAWTNADGRIMATCTGWELLDASGAVVDSGSGNVCSYVHPTPSCYRHLVWQWTVTAGTVKTFMGDDGGDWFSADNWSDGRVPTESDDVLVENKSVTAAGAIVARRLTLDGPKAVLAIGRSDHSLNVGANIASNLTVSGGAKLYVYAGELDDYTTIFTNYSNAYHALYTNANVIAVGGTFTVGQGSIVYPVNAVASGTPVFFKVKGDVTVEEGAMFDTRKLGWGWMRTDSIPKGCYVSFANAKYGKNIWSLCRGAGFSWTAGGGYGGRTVFGNKYYGWDYGYANAPFLAGGPGGANEATTDAQFVEGRGSGSICILANGDVEIGGQLLATGTGKLSSMASGGGIWVAGRNVTLATTAVLNADGGSSSSSTCPPGGGGRIAIVRGLSEADWDVLAEGGTVAESEESTLTHPGVSVVAKANAVSGTSKLVSLPNAYVAVEVRGDPIEADGVEYGTATYCVGEKVFSATEYAEDPANPGRASYACAGYVVSNAVGNVWRGSGTSVSVTLEAGKGPYVLTWLWEVREVILRVAAPSADMGTLTVDGAVQSGDVAAWIDVGFPLTVSVTPAEGRAFNCWLGDVPRGSAGSASLAWTSVTDPITLTPILYVQGDPTDCVWIDGRTGDYYVAANWVGGTVPTPEDCVTISNGVCTASGAITVGSLTLAGTTQFSVSGAESVRVNSDLLLRETATLTVAALPTDESHTIVSGTTTVSVGGDLILEDDAVLRPVCDAWTGGTPVFWVGKWFKLGTNATVNANEAGWGWRTYEGAVSTAARATAAVTGAKLETQALGPGVGKTRGGTMTYGYANGPCWPGSPNGVYSVGTQTRGGGVIRIHAYRSQIEGVLDASANTTSLQSGGSGGSIWLTSWRFFFGTNAVLRAKGGWSSIAASKGGGGRISVGTSLDSDRIQRLVMTGTCGRKVRGIDRFSEEFPDVTVDVTCGDTGSGEPDSEGSFTYYPLSKGFTVIVR